MVSQEGGSPGSLLEHVQRAIVHGMSALRCYVNLLAAEADQRARRLAKDVVLMIILAGVALAGIIIFAAGLARWLDSCIGAPGAGAMIVGGGMVGLALLVLLVRAGRKERDQ
jgi:hypothetical protein